MTRTTLFAASLTISLAVIQPTLGAGIVSSSGDVAEISAPASVQLGTLESDSNAHLFVEKEGESLASNLSVDISTSGTYGPGFDTSTFPSGVISAGTLVNSYFLHVDKVGISTPTLSFSGSVTFSAPVLGIITEREQLLASHSIVGASGTQYDEQAINLATVNLGDQVVLSNDLMTVTFQTNTDSGADNIRIITAIPEPQSIVLLALAALGFTRLKRR